jgi:hypothetical protein
MKDDAGAIVLTEDKPMVAADLLRLQQGLTSCDLTYRILHKVTGFTWMHARARVIGSQAGCPVVLVLFLDTSVIKETQEELRRTSVMYEAAASTALFFLFVLLDPFLGFVESGGGFKALAVLMQPIADLGGKAGLVLTGGLIGAFGISGAAVAQLKVMDSMFGGLIHQQGISMFAWAAALIVGSRVTSLIYPGPNMFGATGFAQSDDIKSVLRNGWLISAAHCTILLLYAIFVS